MAGGVGEVQFVVAPVLGAELHGNRVGFDRDAAFALEVHGVEELLLGFALLDRARRLEKAVGEGGLAMVDVRDDAEVAGVFYGHEGAEISGAAHGWSMPVFHRRFCAGNPIFLR